ncbi:hypothetical protein ACLB2K_017217 [Fragaria x ananassa]
MMQHTYGPFLGRVPEEHVVYIGDYGVDYLDPESLLPARGVAGKKWPSSENWARAIWDMLFCFVVLCLFSLTGGKIAAIRETDMPSLKNTRLGTALLAAAAMSPVGNFTVTNITEVQPVNTAQNITTNNAPEGLVPHNVSLNNAQLSEDERRLDGGRKLYEGDSLEQPVVLFQSEDERRLDGGRKLYEGNSLEEPVVLFQSEDERSVDSGRKLYEGDSLEEPVMLFQSEDESVLQQQALPPMSLYTTPR